MQFRSISPSEVERFAAADPHLSDAAGFVRFIREMWERGSSQPNRCFVVENGTEIIGRVMYRGVGAEAVCTTLYLPWQADYLAVGNVLFQESLRQLQSDGVGYLEVFVKSAWSYAAQLNDLIHHFNLPLTQTKLRYIWKGDLAGFEQPTRLLYRTLNDVGEDVFIDLIRRTSVATLDSIDRQEINTFGAEQHARNYFNLLKAEFECSPTWWLAAYTPDHQVVGHVIGVPFDLGRQEGCIGYIGVVPEQRGHRYIDDLLRRGMSVMFSEGITAVIADTDLQNIPMQQAFERCGYLRGDTSWIYRGEIEAILRS